MTDACRAGALAEVTLVERYRISEVAVTLPAPAPGVPPGARPSVSAEEILDLARRDAEAIRQHAREEGRREGLAEVRAQTQERLQELDALLRVASEERHRLMREAEMELVDLAVAVARHVVEGDPSLLRAAASVAVSEVLAAAHVEAFTIRLHPDDLGEIERERATLGLPPGAGMEADARVGRGGCVLECARGAVDARLDTRWALVGEHLREGESHGN